MGGLVSGIFDLLGGNPSSTEQNQLGSLAGYENNTGEGAVNAGLGYYGNILSGNPQAIAETLAPEISAGQGQVQQQAEQNAIFGNRGGGTNSSTQAAQGQERGNIINLTGQLQQGAASAELGAGENLLGQGSSNLMNEANLANNWRNQENQAIEGVASGVGQIATGLPWSSSSDPYETLYNAQNPDTSGLDTTTSSSDAFL